MALLNPSPVLTLPTAMWLTFQTVTGRGPLTQSDLFSLTSPPSIRRDAATGDREPTAASREAFRALRDYGLITLDEQDRVTATPQDLKPDSYPAFCALLRATLLAPPTTQPPLDEAGANDLLRALAWLLTTNPLDKPWTEPRAAQQSVPHGPTLVFVNNTRWHGFRYWAEALGFAEPAAFGDETGATLVANPTRALRDLVISTYQPGDDLPIARLMHDFRAAAPVLLGGTVSRALGYGFDPWQVDHATAYALASGQLRGWLSMDRRPDAADTMQFAALDRNDQPRVVSHVRIGEVEDV